MSLLEKLKKDVQTQEKAKVDWIIRKEEWLAAVDELYQLIRLWFADYEQEGLVKYSYAEKSNSEEYIGSYTVKVLQMKFPNEKVIIIEPMATLIIGAWGRFDLYLRGYLSEKYFILRFKDEENNFSWNIVNPSVRKDVKPLTKENLEKIFETWLS